MFKPEELLLKEVWTVVLSKLSTEDELGCRCVCNFFKKEVDSILKNQDRLWLRHRKGHFGHYFCYDKDHRIASRDTLYFGRTITTKNLKFVSKLMPSLKILRLDPLDQLYQEDNNHRSYLPLNVEVSDYCDKEKKVVPITKIFPQVECFILPGRTETNNFVSDLSQVKHLTLYHSLDDKPLTFPNLDSLEVGSSFNSAKRYLPMPSKRFVVPNARIKWRSLPKTLEVIEGALDCEEYISVGKPHFGNLKILKGLSVGKYEENENVETLVSFLKDHNESLTELSFSAREEVDSIKVLVPLLTRLQKLSVKIKTDKQAIELKEIKALAHNLQYFELLLVLRSSTYETLGAILENLPLDLDNFSMQNFWSYENIKPFMEKIMEKIINGDTKRVTIAVYGNRENIIKEIVEMKPEAVRVEKKNERGFELDNDHCNWGIRTDVSRRMSNIILSL